MLQSGGSVKTGEGRYACANAQNEAIAGWYDGGSLLGSTIAEGVKTMNHATILTDRFDRALLYATHVHGGQVRKGTSTPYVAHLIAVSATVLARQYEP
jgi:hypothetical protein